MDDGVVAQKARGSTLDEFFPSGRASGSWKKLNGRGYKRDDDEDLRRFIRGGLAAK